MQNTNKHSGWLEEMAAAEMEYGGIIAGRLGSPDDQPPIGPVEEAEETLRQILRANLQEMLDKETALKAQCSFPNAVFQDCGFMMSEMNYASK